MAGIYDAFDSRAHGPFIFINQLNDDWNVIKRLIVLNSEY